MKYKNKNFSDCGYCPKQKPKHCPFNYISKSHVIFNDFCQNCDLGLNFLPIKTHSLTAKGLVCFLQLNDSLTNDSMIYLASLPFRCLQTLFKTSSLEQLLANFSRSIVFSLQAPAISSIGFVLQIMRFDTVHTLVNRCDIA